MGLLGLWSRFAVLDGIDDYISTLMYVEVNMQSETSVPLDDSFSGVGRITMLGTPTCLEIRFPRR